MNWEKVFIGDLCKLKHGYAFKGEYFTTSGDYVLLTPGNFLEEGGIKLKGDKEKYYVGQFPEVYILNEGDMLVVLTDLIQAAPILGGAGIINTGGRYLHNQRLGLVTDICEAKVLPKFLYYVFNSQNFRHQVRASATGSTVRHTAPERIYKCQTSLPPLPIQRRIANILSAYDDLIENNQRRIKLLEDAARCEYKMLMNENEIVKKVTLKDLITTVKKLVSVRSDQYDEIGQYPIIDQSTDFIGGYTNDKTKIYDTLHPVIVFGDHTRILKYVNFPFATGADGTQIVKPKLETLPTSFLYFALLYSNLQNYHYARHFKFLKEQVIGLPKDSVLVEYGNIAQGYFDLIYILRNQNTQLRQARDILLPKLMSGEIEVNEYTPASTVIEMGKYQTMAAEDGVPYTTNKPANQL